MEQEDQGVTASPPGHSYEPASSLAADAGSVPNAEEIDDFCRAVLADNLPRTDEPFGTIAKYLRAAKRIGYKAGRASLCA